MNIANSSEFNEAGKEFLGNGIIPINNFYSTTEGDYVNYLNMYLVDEKYQPAEGKQWDNVGINRLTPIYNGKQYNSSNLPGSADKSNQVDPNIFLAYDFSANPEDYKTWSSYPRLDNKYGYISRLGQTVSTFLNNYCNGGGDKRLIYFDGKYYNEYGSTIYVNSNSYYSFCNMMFNYDVKLQIPIWQIAVFFVALSLIFMAIAYRKYITFDFKYF